MIPTTTLNDRGPGSDELAASGSLEGRFPLPVRPLGDPRLWARLRQLVDVLAILAAVLAVLLDGPAAQASDALAIATFAVSSLLLLHSRWSVREQLAVGSLDACARAVASCAIGAMLAIAVGALAGSAAPSSIGLRLWVLTVALLCGVRTALGLVERRARARGLLMTPTLVVGAGVVGAWAVRRLEQQPSLGLRPIGSLDAGSCPESTDQEIDLPVLGTPADAIEVARRTAVPLPPPASLTAVPVPPPASLTAVPVPPTASLAAVPLARTASLTAVPPPSTASEPEPRLREPLPKPALRLVEPDIPAAAQTQWFCGYCGISAFGHAPPPTSRVCTHCGAGLLLEAPADVAPEPEEPFLVIDARLTVQAVSRCAEEMLGVKETEITDHPITELIADADAELNDQTSFVTALTSAAQSDEDRWSTFVRPRDAFGIRIRARISHCGPPRAALIVFETTRPDSGPRLRLVPAERPQAAQQRP